MRDISPELALVDPELAAAARAGLPDPPPAAQRLVAEEPARRRRRRAPLAIAVLLGVLGAAVGVGVAGSGGQSAEVAPDAGTAGVLGARKLQRTPPKSLPASGRPGRVFAWNETKGAAFYQVTFVRNGKPFHTARTPDPWLKVPDALKFPPGTYRWSVRPAVAGESGIALGDAVAVHTFRVRRR